MFPQITIKHNIGNVIDIPNQLVSKASTYLSSNILAGVPTLPADNASVFSSGNILLLLSSMGAENAEFVTASAHTDTSFTVGATKFLHNRGDAISQVTYNQITIHKSATQNGTYVLLSTVTIDATEQNTIVLDPAGLSTDYYKVRWETTIPSAAHSDFSSPISVLAYPINSVATVVYPVLKAMGVSENDPKINVEFLLGAIDDARKFTEGKLYGIRHAWLQKFEHPIPLLAGNNWVDLPDDIDFTETDRSVLAARFLIGNILAPYNLRKIDKRSWNQIAFTMTGGYTTVDALIGATELFMDSVGDFTYMSNNGGVAYVATTGYNNQTIMQIAYTSVDFATKRMLGVTGIIRDIPAGTRVWNNPVISQPIYYTVYENKLVFERVIPDSMQGVNMYIDYYTLMPKVENLYQELPEHYREIYKWYLRYAIKYRKDIALGSDDPDLKKFEDLVQALFNNLYTGQDTTIITG